MTSPVSICGLFVYLHIELLENEPLFSSSPCRVRIFWLADCLLESCCTEDNLYVLFAWRWVAGLNSGLFSLGETRKHSRTLYVDHLPSPCASNLRTTITLDGCRLRWFFQWPVRRHSHIAPDLYLTRLHYWFVTIRLVVFPRQTSELEYSHLPIHATTSNVLRNCIHLPFI